MPTYAELCGSIERSSIRFFICHSQRSEEICFSIAEKARPKPRLSSIIQFLQSFNLPSGLSNQQPGTRAYRQIRDSPCTGCPIVRGPQRTCSLGWCPSGDMGPAFILPSTRINLFTYQREGYRKTVAQSAIPHAKPQRTEFAGDPTLRDKTAKNGATSVYCFRICRYVLATSNCL